MLCLAAARPRTGRRRLARHLVATPANPTVSATRNLARQHQRKDDYWKHGSISEDYSDQVKIPALVISGWADGYLNAPPAAVAQSPNGQGGINGPWVHKYPHLALPKPRIDFLGEAVNWWDKWLKGR